MVFYGPNRHIQKRRNYLPLSCNLRQVGFDRLPGQKYSRQVALLVVCPSGLEIVRQLLGILLQVDNRRRIRIRIGVDVVVRVPQYHQGGFKFIGGRSDLYVR